MPLVVVLMIDVPLPSRTPSVVENSTAVPLGTGALFCVTLAVMVTVESTTGLGFDTDRVTTTPVGGVVPPGGIPPPGGGAVGLSPLQAANSSRTAMTTI